MRTETVVILERKDLFIDSRKKDIEEIKITDFLLGQSRQVVKTPIILFNDDDGEIRVLKNRYNTPFDDMWKKGMDGSFLVERFKYKY